jgi:uroporphyrinogen-III synthase
MAPMETQPLDGFLVGVTADRRAEEQCEMLRRRGARVLHGASVHTVPLAPDDGIRPATEALLVDPPEVLVANTGIGIRSWFVAAESWGLGEALHGALAGARIVARGPKAAGAILTAGLDVEWRAPSEMLAEVVDQVVATAPPGTHVAVQLDGNTEQRQLDRLRAAGMTVTPVRVYEWTRPTEPDGATKLLAAVCDGQVDAVTFTSAAAVDNFFALADEQDRGAAVRDALNGSVIAMCVGPVCAQAAARHGVGGRHPERPRLGAMVHELTSLLSDRRRSLRLAGRDVVVQGAAVTIDGERAVLTDRERAVLEVLVQRGGGVVTRAELLRAVWGNQADEHAMEMTITRLRRRLGAAGTAVRTVVRRGYRLELDA